MVQGSKKVHPFYDISSRLFCNVDRRYAIHGSENLFFVLFNVQIIFHFQITFSKIDRASKMIL